MPTRVEESPFSDERSRRSPLRVAASLPRRYLAVFASVAALLVVDQAVIQPLLVQVSLYAPTINVAGRQRMLSQRLSKAALMMQAAGDETGLRAAQHELGDALAQWTRAHHGLQFGDESLDLSPTHAPAIRQQFARLEPHFEQMQAAGRKLAKLRPQGNEDTAARINPYAATILRHEVEYLPTMDRIVGLYEQQARREVLVLRLVGLALTVGVILLMTALGQLVLRPANRLILQQVQQLEDRVEQRTAQLSRSNQALRREMQERQQAEQRTQQLSSQLAHASRVTAIGQLATGLAHEINQPLAAINNYAESCGLLLDQPPADVSGVRSALGRIAKAALRAGEIVRRMRRFVRPLSSDAPEAAPPVSVNDLIGEVDALCRPELAGADVALHLDLALTLADVRVDSIRIQQVLVNLIQNAVQALRSVPRTERRIVLRTSQQANAMQGESVQIDVIDNGPGFAAEPESVFKPFFTTREEGLGMGLAISRRIIEEHGGRLWAEANPDGGAIVRFTLPAHENESKSDGVSDAQRDAHCVCR